ncbi:hypothetical protein KIN20_033357 [Parelaphostrongylus tenuis]|uniref:Uncharacterized protein n=1 Tax=Parelaphostrongylus tenuis TaxID=148309 RepID=A0AAD5WIQ4_PARTN|nr:hypothetical protein KIN20_033357 [Parelaphostrongylus tenuis]
MNPTMEQERTPQTSFKNDKNSNNQLNNHQDRRLQPLAGQILDNFLPGRLRAAVFFTGSGIIADIDALKHLIASDRVFDLLAQCALPARVVWTIAMEILDYAHGDVGAAHGRGNIIADYSFAVTE